MNEQMLEAIYLIAIARVALAKGVRPRTVGLDDDDSPIIEAMVVEGATQEEAREFVENTYNIPGCAVIHWAATGRKLNSL